MFNNFFSWSNFFKAEYYAPSRSCFQRKTNRYGKIGTWSNHQQYLLVNRDIATGRFIPKIRQVH